MAKKDFLKTKFVNKLMLFNVFDINEFVLNVIEDIKKGNNGLNAFEVSNAKRYSYELCRVGENEMQKDEISTEDYLYRKENFDDTMYFYSELNYIEFENEFPLDMLYLWYDDEWLHDYHYNKCFFPEVKKWIDKTQGDASKKLRTRKLLNLLNRSNKALKNIETSWNERQPINAIQKTVIEIHLGFTSYMIESITDYYSSVFNELFKVKIAKETDRISLAKNPYARIFKNDYAFLLFESLKESLCKNIKTELADYSFVFRILYSDKYIYEAVKESEFRTFLNEEYHVNLDKLKTLNNCSPNKKREIYNLVKQQIEPK
jgi:hypothetical protein